MLALCTVAEGVARSLGELSGHDRFRIITFSSDAHDLTRGWKAATAPNVEDALEKLRGLSADKILEPVMNMDRTVCAVTRLRVLSIPILAIARSTSRIGATPPYIALFANCSK